ncbi:hypothetical protein [Pseudodesulfovibrio piezophilus]|uniref:TPR repeat n=1 Tax=Pseudodesulfovibrio piezophilus (strain DSM 21447 / JCM 15486 / C1TLV30) TaxID=1322246 RepID=M1WQC7_PSEP2|nr:hypothetical protein [Pseudodesulfovibrio piezophilus]CCH48874.1 TPR repeat [Pseudodesulfovibrio piezophilus C1TLV30]
MSSLHRLGMFNREGMKAFNNGQVEDALFQLAQANRIARQMGSPLHEAKVRNNLGLVHQSAGNEEEALVCFRLAAKSAVKGAGIDNSLHKVISRNLSRLEHDIASRAV